MNLMTCQEKIHIYSVYKECLGGCVASALSKNNYIVDYRYLNNLGKFIKVQKDKNTLMDNNNGCVQQRKQLSKRFALIGLYF